MAACLPWTRNQVSEMSRDAGDAFDSRHPLQVRTLSGEKGDPCSAATAIRTGAFHAPDLEPPGGGGKLRRQFVYSVKPVAQATRDGSADGVGLVGVDLDPGHVGQGQPCLAQNLRARG